MSLVANINDLASRIATEFKDSRPAGMTNAIQLKADNGRLSADATFVFDPATKSLGLGTATPSARLHVQASSAETRDLFRATDAAGKKFFRVTKEGLVAIGDDRDAVYTFSPNAALDINDARGMTIRDGYGSVGLGFNIRTDTYLRVKRTNSTAQEEFYIGPSLKNHVMLGGSGGFILGSGGDLILNPGSAGEGKLQVGRRPNDNAATSGVHAEFWGSTMANNGIIVTKAPGGVISLFSTYRDGNTDIAVNSPSVIPLTLKGAASQTADLQQWVNGSGTVLHAIKADGSLEFMSEATPPASTDAPARWVKVLLNGAPYRLPLYS